MKTLLKMTFALALVSVLVSACSIHSTTQIKSKERFLLGNNPHKSFRVTLKNISETPIEIYRAPMAGGRHSGETVEPGKTVRVKVEPNTALVIINNGETEASVKLTVRGDTGLSMGYANN